MISKKAKVWSVILAQLLVFAVFGAAPVSAETTNVNVTLTAGNLTLVQVPDMNFTSGQIGAAALSLAPSDSANYEIKVNDYRGATTGWHLNAAPVFRRHPRLAQTFTAACPWPRSSRISWGHFRVWLILWTIPPSRPCSRP